ncbi:MAG TPA: hypothetical protein VFE23_10120 [Usitatibacter sp.]|jgi:hypothetical protein|nr:hypothetical protein [Usitatibacter sp.]
MTAGPLHPDNLTSGRDRQLGRGHGVDALGPSDSSDTGSDVVGNVGLAGQVDGFGIQRETSEFEESTAHGTAGPDVGDANLDSDSDSTGTGEAATAGRDTVVEAGADIDTDHIETLPEDFDAPGRERRKKR